MGLAMAIGNFIFGPLDRLFPSRKSIVLIGNMAVVLNVTLLVLFVDHSIFLSTVLLAMVGFCGATYVVIIAHAKNFFPERLMGRGVTLLNLFGIGGVGVFQSLSGQVYDSVSKGLGPVEKYQVLFSFFGLALILGCLVYALSRDGPNHI